MSKTIIVNTEATETRAAVLEDGHLVDLQIERATGERYVGNIYKGRVENVLPGMQAAFVNIGLERNAFLYVEDVLTDDFEFEPSEEVSIRDVLKGGQEIIVQVTKEPLGTKGARVVSQITLPGRYVVLLPTANYVGVSRRIGDAGERNRLRKIAYAIKPKDMGLIMRTAAEGKDDKEFISEARFLAKLWRRIRAKARRLKAPALLHHDYDLVYRLVRDLFTEEVDEFILDDPHEHEKALEVLSILSPGLRRRVKLYSGRKPIFDRYGIEGEIEKALRRKVWLDCGGYLVFDHTEAFTSIDVNTGKFIGTTNLADTVLKTNLQAAAEIARQLRLRNIGGIIVIDFIDMDSEADRKKVLSRLEEELKKDRTKATVLGFTQLGLVEMTRKKTRPGLEDILERPCPYCEGHGRVLSEETVTAKAQREIRRVAANSNQEAMLVVVNPSVAALLIGPGGANLARLEEETGKSIYVKGSKDVHLQDIDVFILGSREEIERKALPVQLGDVMEVEIEEQHQTNPRDGIVRQEGYIIDIEGAGGLVGKRVKIEVVKVFRTYAKAVLLDTSGLVC